MSDYKFYTPIDLMEVLLEHLPPQKIRSVVDISCGSFNLLKAALRKFPQAKCVGVDIEEQNLDNAGRICFIKQDGRVFAKEQQRNKKCFDLIVTNPPFGRLKSDERIFQNEQSAILCSRYECEMMYANELLAHEDTQMIAFLPVTFVEGDLYIKYRRKIAQSFDVHTLVRLPENVFSKGDIRAYAIILTKAAVPKNDITRIGVADRTEKSWSVTYTGSITRKSILNGVWRSDDTNANTHTKVKVDSIFRGNISSASFSSTGTKVLHCSSIFDKGCWKPLQCYCTNHPLSNEKYVHDGDIIVNRIGKSAGFWTKYHGETQLISDCLIVIRGGEQVEEHLQQHSANGRIMVPIKGVATKYISISDLISYYFSISKQKHMI